jgi:hypothetical protein
MHPNARALSAPPRKRDPNVTRPQVIVYELNEVPWSIIDRYVKERPDSALAAALPGARCLTTHEEDTDNLLPWRTWPTFHKSMHTPEHNSYELGQDPATFCGENIWDVAEEAGLRVGFSAHCKAGRHALSSTAGFLFPTRSVARQRRTPLDCDLIRPSTS